MYTLASLQPKQIRKGIRLKQSKARRLLLFSLSNIFCEIEQNILWLFLIFISSFWQLEEMLRGRLDGRSSGTEKIEI